MQCGIGRALQGLRQAGVTDQPHGDQVARVEREVEEGREVAEEFRRQVLCFVDDPQRRQLLAVDQLVYPVLAVALQLRTAVEIGRASCRDRVVRKGSYRWLQYP